MTALSSYSTGTVTIAAGGTVVTGVGTIWSDGSAKPGDILQVGNFQSVITDTTDGTHLVIPPWGGGAQVGAAYKIWQVSPQRFAGADAMATVNKLVIALNAREIPIVVGDDETVPDPSLGEEDQTAIQPSTGKVWVMSGGVWTFLGIYRGFNPRGAYNGATVFSVGDVATDAGTSYVWINPTPGSGHAPPNATYWQVLAGKGDPGATGPSGAGYGGTSTTSLAIGTGAKAFTTQAGLAYTNGARVRASSAANASNWMEGVATYAGTALTITVDKTGGSGTRADWNFNVAGQPGAGDLSSVNNLSDVANAATARTNLGAGTVNSVTGGAGLTGGAITNTGTLAVDYASKSDQQTGSSTVKSVNPAHQQDHDSAAKAWAIFHWSGSAIVIDASYNISSISRVGAGIYTVNFTTGFASALYSCQVSVEDGGNTSTGCIAVITSGTRAVGSVQIRFYNQAMSAVVDPAFAHFAAFGRQ